jgi:N4-gp56 family major capsid protein
MADTVTAIGLRAQQWDSKFFVQYIQEGPFRDMYGTDETSIIQLKENLGKGTGDSISIALVNRLTNLPTTGTSVLEGNEEDLASRSFRIYIDKVRNAVRIAEMEEIKSAIDLRDAGRASLLTWAKEYTRDKFITELGSVASTGTNSVSFVNRTAAIGDAWLVNNLDRVYFGAGVGSGTDLSADLAQLDTTNDLFTNVALDGMVLKAKTASPKIRPIRDEKDGRRYYVALANPYAFKNLRDSIDTEVLAITNVQAEAAKLFEGGDIHWNGVIIKEVDDLPIYSNIGASGTAEVTPVYLMGAQALAMVHGKRFKSMTKEFDYGDKFGVAIEAIMGQRKVLFGTGTADTDTPKDHGVVTGFFATTGAGTANGLNSSTGTSAELP